MSKELRSEVINFLLEDARGRAEGSVKKQFGRASNDPYPSEKLAPSPIVVKVYQPVYDALFSLPKEERAGIIRKVLTEYAVKELGVILAQ